MSETYAPNQYFPISNFEFRISHFEFPMFMRRLCHNIQNCVKRELIIRFRRNKVPPTAIVISYHQKLTMSI